MIELSVTENPLKSAVKGQFLLSDISGARDSPHREVVVTGGSVLLPAVTTGAGTLEE